MSERKVKGDFPIWDLFYFLKCKNGWLRCEIKQWKLSLSSHISPTSFFRQLSLIFCMENSIKILIFRRWVLFLFLLINSCCCDVKLYMQRGPLGNFHFHEMYVGFFYIYLYWDFRRSNSHATKKYGKWN